MSLIKKKKSFQIKVSKFVWTSLPHSSNKPNHEIGSCNKTKALFIETHLKSFTLWCSVKYCYFLENRNFILLSLKARSLWAGLVDYLLIYFRQVQGSFLFFNRHLKLITYFYLLLMDITWFLLLGKVSATLYWVPIFLYYILYIQRVLIT